MLLDSSSALALLVWCEVSKLANWPAGWNLWSYSINSRENDKKKISCF